MPKFKFKVVFPPQVIYEVEAKDLMEARVAANQLWFKAGWYRVRPACPLQPATEEIPLIHSEKELIRSLDGLMQTSLYMDPQGRYSVKRLTTLRKIQESTGKYQERLAEMQVTLKQRRLALDKEVEHVASMETKAP